MSVTVIVDGRIQKKHARVRTTKRAGEEVHKVEGESENKEKRRGGAPALCESALAVIFDDPAAGDHASDLFLRAHVWSVDGV